jgi:dihydrofolate reductase
MRRLSVYNSVSLDGYLKDCKSDMSWAHQHDPEWNEFVSSNASGGAVLLFDEPPTKSWPAIGPRP